MRKALPENNGEECISPEPDSTLTIEMCGNHYDAAVFGPMLVFCIRHLGSYASVSSAWERLLDWAVTVGANLRAPRVGVLYDDPAATPADRTRYDACLVTSEEDVQRLGLLRPGVLPPGIRIENLPRVSAWRTVHHGSYRTLAQAYAVLSVAEAAEANGTGRFSRTPPFYEIYLTDPRFTPADEQVTEVYLPRPGEPGTTGGGA